MTPDIESAEVLMRHREATLHSGGHRLFELLIDRLPDRIRTPTHWLRQPSSRWARVPAALLLVCGGLLFFLPLLGLWMLPLGLMLLAEDIPPLRRTRDRILQRIARRWPDWFIADDAARSSESASLGRR
jgi:hypothetical protein